MALYTRKGKEKLIAFLPLGACRLRCEIDGEGALEYFPARTFVCPRCGDAGRQPWAESFEKDSFLGGGTGLHGLEESDKQILVLDRAETLEEGIDLGEFFGSSRVVAAETGGSVAEEFP